MELILMIAVYVIAAILITFMKIPNDQKEGET